VDKLIDFYYGNRIQNGNLRVLAWANSLSPTKGKGPFSATLSPTIKGTQSRVYSESQSSKAPDIPNSGILAKFQSGVTKGPTRNYSWGGG
jgi:hypothetical protein